MSVFDEPLTSARPPLFPWFGGANLLFLEYENASCREVLVTDAQPGSSFSYDLVNPGSALGYEAFIGRYFACGKYGFGISYFNFDPSNESLLITPAVLGDYRATISAYNQVSIDPGTGVNTVYNHYDGAAAYRLQRDIDFQGIEANLFCFGLMGGLRSTPECAAPACDGPSGKLGWLTGNSCGYGFGGAGRPLVRPSTGGLQVMASHGFRWFQVEDSLEFAANINGTAGYQADDLYHNIDVDNNLYGYQFGTRLTYCLFSRTNVNIGGKVGLYGNDIELRDRLGTETTAAYMTGDATQTVDSEYSETALATLSELDLGLGYRLCNAWTVTGGYRVLALTGVATAPSQFADQYTSALASRDVCATDSILLHGAYVGLNFNW